MDGEKIEVMRQERGLSCQEFAKEEGVAASTVARVERGEAVRLSTFRRIGAALGIEPKGISRPVRQ
jgi:transcriptional regulator with XRE-family HTH domain